MTRIDEILAHGRSFSVEMWPPKTAEATARLRAVFDELSFLKPSFTSITYGAGGSTRDLTNDLVIEILGRGDMNPMAHLTCVAHRRDELVDILERYKQAGVDNILALRGDAPAGSGEKWPKGDLEHAIELVELAREVGPFSVGVAAHPEGHPLSSDLATDRRHLASKLRVADFAITQFFFRVEDYLRMVDDLARLGVDKPVIPGIMPILNIRSVVRMAQMSGAAVPQEVARRVEAVAHDPVAVRRVGVQVACELAERLIDAGAPGLHIYTLNQSAATLEIAARLGLGEYQSAP